MSIRGIWDKIVPRKRVSDTIYLTLKKAIIFGLISPQDKIDEHYISQELDVSQGSIKEAIKILEDDKYLIFDKRKGYIVESVTLENIIKLYEFLNVLSMAAIESINLNNVANIIMLEESIKKAKESTNYQLDKKFHTTLALCSYNNEIIIATNDAFDRLLWGINVLPLHDINSVIIDDHEVIVRHLLDKSNDMEILTNIMCNHYDLHLQDIHLKK